jgi:phage gpG-like protein
MARSRVKVIDHGWKRIKKEIDKIHKSYVKVGAITGGGEKKYTTHDSVPGGEPQGNQNRSMTVAHLASVHEFGVPSQNIPSRPFMAQAFNKNKSKLKKVIRQLVSDIFKGSIKTDGALRKLGVIHQGQVRETITSGSFTPLKTATVRRKGSSKPLQDTGRLKQSIDFEVVIK